MAVPDHARANFQTLLRAAGDGNLALMECLDAHTQEVRYVICAVGHDGSDYVMTLEELNAFIANPGAAIPGTSMSFNGLSDQNERVDLLLYLHNRGSNPQQLP